MKTTPKSKSTKAAATAAAPVRNSAKSTNPRARAVARTSATSPRTNGAKRVEPIPAGREAVIPSLAMRDAKKAIEFYKKAFGAQELGCNLRMPDGKVAHAELHIGAKDGHGGAIVMLADENPQWGNLSPQSVGGTPVTIHLYVDDVDAVVARAVKLGAKLLAAPADQFYGDRAGRIQDPFGHVWGLATHVEDMTVEEMERRFGEWMKNPPKK